MFLENDNDTDDKKTRVISIPGKNDIIVKLADNSEKNSEISEKSCIFNEIHSPKSRKSRHFSFYRNRRRYFADKSKRHRGTWTKRGGVVLIIRNLTRDVTNADIKTIFGKIGPLRRCGIHWNSRWEKRDIAEVEYLYDYDAFKAYKKLDYKSIKGIPIRIEMEYKKNLFSYNDERFPFFNSRHNYYKLWRRKKYFSLKRRIFGKFWKF